MADVQELKKLSRDKLNEFAKQHGVEDAADEEKYSTKEDLAKAIPESVRDEDVQNFVSGGATASPAASSREAAADDQPAPAEQPAPPSPDSPDDVLDQSGVEPTPGAGDDDQEDEEEEPTPKPRRRSRASADDGEEGMGFKRVNGKTVDIFDSKTPHTHLKNVAGVMVPLSQKSYEEKTDFEIQEQLRKLGKL